MRVKKFCSIILMLVSSSHLTPDQLFALANGTLPDFLFKILPDFLILYKPLPDHFETFYMGKWPVLDHFNFRDFSRGRICTK